MARVRICIEVVRDLPQQVSSLLMSRHCMGFGDKSAGIKKQGGHVVAQVSRHGLPCPPRGHIDMQSRFAILTAGEHACPHHPMCTVNRREHGLRSLFLATYRGNSDATTPYPATRITSPTDTPFSSTKRSTNSGTTSPSSSGITRTQPILPPDTQIVNSSWNSRMFNTGQPCHERNTVSLE